MSKNEPFPSVGQKIEMLCNGKWRKGIVIEGYRYHDGVVTMRTANGKEYWCGQDRTDIYRKGGEDE